jgi:glycosyltransferase involved in cell wall biosynthesis
LVLATALIKLARGRISGRLCGVHVNVAERLSLFRKSAVIILSRALGVPVVLHLHAQLHHSYRRFWWPVQGVVRWVFSLASGCVVLGANAQHFVINELGVPPDRVDIVLNGVPEPVEVRRTRRMGSVQRVLFLGNLSKLKGVSDLLEALAAPELDTSRLEVIFAGGGDIPVYRALAKDLQVDGVVRFRGWVDQHEAAQLMACADVLVLPSYVEGLPLVILEALANGVAVVCSPVGEIPSILTDGVNACFVRPGDVRGIAACLQRLLEQPALMESLEKNGRALYDEKFSLTRFFRSVAFIHRRYFGAAGEPLHPDPNVAATQET